MSITRLVANAHASIRAKLALVPGSNALYTHVDFPGVLLREIPLGSLTQFGGMVNIQRNATGVRTIGAAGSWLTKFPSQSLPGAAMEVVYSGYVTKVGIAAGRGNTTTIDQLNPGYNFCDSKATAVSLVDGTPRQSVNGLSTSDLYKWTAAAVLDELLLGWVCPVNSAVIWEGDVVLRHAGMLGGSYPEHGVYRFQSSATMAAMVNMPLAIDWANVDLVSLKANYLVGTTTDTRPYVSDAWDQCLPALKAVKNIIQPVPVLYSSRGLEISPNFARYLSTRAYCQYGVDTWTSAMTAFLQTGGAQLPAGTGLTADPYCSTVARLPGSSVNGLVMPRFNPARVVITSLAGDQGNIDAFVYSADPPFVSTNGGFPSTITNLPAAPLLGPIFPAVYAAGGMLTPAGDLALSSLITVLGENSASLVDPAITSIAGNGTTTQGDASIAGEGQPFTTLDTTLMSWNYGMDATMKSFVQSVRAKTEALVRAKKSTFGF